jgi:tRNA nucleotidyltransferase (CCA-adding enzyme)
MTDHGANLAARIEALPGMQPVISALADLPPTFLVGGAVRDLLRGAAGVDLDLAVEGDAGAVARELAARLGGRAVEHDRFGTASVRAGALVIDLAATRRERYPTPGALPEVEPASLEEDLARRDFTVNAMAASLSGAELGRLHDPHGGATDLGEGWLRVLHERSFVDDPTRLLRAVRYETRLDLAMDEGTEALAHAAAEEGTLTTVSGPRVRDELLDLLAEPNVAVGVERLRELGLDRALHPEIRADSALVASAALATMETGADRAWTALAALVVSAPDALAPWVDGLGLRAGDRDRVLRAVRRAPELRRALEGELRPSDLHALLEPEPAEALALALGLGAPGGPVLDFLSELRGTALEITGTDLLAAGVPESSAVGRALRETLRRKLDGEVSGRERELALALELARGGGQDGGR